MLQQKIETAGGLRLILSPLILFRCIGKPSAWARNVLARTDSCPIMAKSRSSHGFEMSPLCSQERTFQMIFLNAKR